MTTTQSSALANLAVLLSIWVEGDRREYCLSWARYYREGGEKPGKSGDKPALKDSDYFVYQEALECVRFGWSSIAHQHAERVERRMRQTPKLEKFPAGRVWSIPQPWDGKR